MASSDLRFRVRTWSFTGEFEAENLTGEPLELVGITSVTAFFDPQTPIL